MNYCKIQGVFKIKVHIAFHFQNEFRSSSSVHVQLQCHLMESDEPGVVVVVVVVIVVDEPGVVVIVVVVVVVVVDKQDVVVVFIVVVVDETSGGSKNVSMENQISSEMIKLVMVNVCLYHLSNAAHVTQCHLNLSHRAVWWLCWT